MLRVKSYLKRQLGGVEENGVKRGGKIRERGYGGKRRKRKEEIEGKKGGKRGRWREQGERDRQAWGC